MRLLIDVNLSPRWRDWLADAGFEAVHWSTIGPLDAPDSTIMVYAARETYVVFTHDLDFSAILAATGGRKPSVVQVRGTDIRPEVIGPVLVKALHQAKGDLAAGALLTVDFKRSRLRILPLTS